MKKLIILATFFLLACLDLFIVKSLVCAVGHLFGGEFLIPSTLQAILQVLLVFAVLYLTTDVELTLFTAAFTVAGVEDVFYFLLDFLMTKTIPSGELWWMIQYQIFGTWNLTLHLFWMAFWLFFAFTFGKLKTRE